MKIKEALFYRSLENREVQCVLCPHNCRILPGKTGRCRVRKNHDGKLYSLNYARYSSSNLDPIEKKPLYHFFPGGNILSLGTVGCNLSCSFCQNWNISQAPQKPGDEKAILAATQSTSPDEAAQVASKLIPHKNIGVAYTYNEPTVWYEFVLESSRKVKAAGLSNVLVTNGYINEQPLKELLPYIDAANVDLKSFKDDFYRKNCGGSLEPVLNSLKMFRQKVLLEVTTLLIPGLNDSNEELNALTDWIVKNLGRDTPLHFSRYHPDYRLEVPNTPVDSLERAYSIAEKKLYYVYVGNLPGNPWEFTYCPGCRRKLLERANLQLVNSWLKPGNACSDCRLPVNIKGKVMK